MSLLEIINKLKAAGHKVVFSHRKDGGYVIRSIDGTHYTGKTGNAIARAIVGTTLSEARKVQLQRIRTPKGKKATKKSPIPEELDKLLKKVQRSWRKRHKTIEGTISRRGLRYQIETYGEEKAYEALDKAYRYSEGYAYLDNVKHLLDRIRLDLNKRPSPDMEKVIQLINDKMMTFREDWLNAIYSTLYEWEKGVIDDKECARQIREIIR